MATDSKDVADVEMKDVEEEKSNAGEEKDPAKIQKDKDLLSFEGDNVLYFNEFH